MNKLIIFLILSLLWLNGFGQRSTANGVAGYWRMETIASAVSETGENTGTNSNISSGTGIQNNCYDFNGTTSKVVVSDNSSINFGNGDFSLSCWIKTTTTTRSALIDKSNTGGSYTKGGYVLEVALFAGQISFHVHSSTGANNIVNVTENFNDGGWHHIAATRSGSTIYVYFDGDLSGSTAVTLTIANSTIPLGLGYFTQIDNYYDGLIDEVVTYNRGISLLEVKNHYAGGNGLFYITENWINNKITDEEFNNYYWDYIGNELACTN